MTLSDSCCTYAIIECINIFMNSYYNKNLKKYSRENRQKQTPAESVLWSRLRRKEFLGLRFLRQKPIYKYIVDFYQPEHKLIIEIDGSSHDDVKFSYDQTRHNDLEMLGFEIIRFTEHEVMSNITNVLLSIELKINRN